MSLTALSKTVLFYCFDFQFELGVEENLAFGNFVSYLKRFFVSVYFRLFSFQAFNFPVPLELLLCASS